MALGDISDRLDLPKSATHRLLRQLSGRGYVQQDDASQRYWLTMRLAILGFRYVAATRLNDVCQPELDRLAQRTGELVRMTVVEGEKLIWVADAQGSRYGLRYDGLFGQDVVPYATANGKVWLAALQETDAIRVVLNEGLGRRAALAANTITTIAQLIETLQKTREQGYGVVIEEAEPGIAAVAVTIAGLHSGDPVVGTVSVAGPATRLGRERLDEFVPALRQTSTALARLWPIRKHLTTRTRIVPPPGNADDSE
jgi:DNA-binding IclR family transcriptional regulator